jgi:hypothetical protein
MAKDEFARILAVAAFATILVAACTIEDLPSGHDRVDSDGASDSSAPPPDAPPTDASSNDADGPIDAGCNLGDADTNTDPRHCGTCGHDCLGASCTNGKCGAVLLTAATGVGAVSVAGGYVYYVEGFTSGSISRVPVGGGAAEPLRSGLPWVNSVVADETYVFYSGYGSSPGTNGYVTRMPAAGGSGTDIIATLNYPNSIALEGSYVYWGANYGKDVQRAPKAGGAPTPLFTGSVTNTNVSVGADATDVYFTLWDEGTVSRAPGSGGGGATPVASSQNHPCGVVSDGTYVYWANAGTAPQFTDGAIMRSPVSGGGATPIATNQCDPTGWLRVDATHVYWTNNCDGGSVMRVAKAGGTVEPLATGQTSAGGIDLDASSAYWGSANGVYRIAK